MNHHQHLSQRFQLPNYYYLCNLPAADLCQIFIFQSSKWKEIEACVRNVFDGDTPTTKVRIYTESGVSDEMVSQCRTLIDQFKDDLDIEVRANHTAQQLAFVIGYIDGIIHYHRNLSN